MTGFFDLLFSYAMIGAGFVVFGTLIHAWLFPHRLGSGSLMGLVAVSSILALVGFVLVVLGLNWHRAAADTGSAPGPREL